MNCPRCNHDMQLINFRNEVKLPSGRILPRYVFRCPACMLDSSPPKLPAVLDEAFVAYPKYEVSRLLDDQVTQLLLFSDQQPDFSHFLSNAKTAVPVRPL